MGQVWLAEHRGLDIQVAVKFMRRDLADDPVSVARFEQEAKFAARIKSPHVVEVFDYDVTETGVPFIVMESLRGRDLEVVLQNGRTLGISDTARVLVQTCKALSKAHALGVIHRDIKAENVFVVQEEGVPLIKVLDFGVAKETASAHGISLSGTTVGTPSYMSPEQLFHPKEIDLRTDLWATAVLVYRCLTGSFPFEGESFASVCLSVSKGKFATPSAVNSVLPGALDAWFKRAFHKSLDARFSSAAEMSESFLSELRKADLLPPWAEAPAKVPSSGAITQVSVGNTFFAVTTPRRSGARRLGGLVRVAAALATVLVFEVAPPPIRAPFVAFAGQVTERARLWAINEGFLPPSLENSDDTSSLTYEGAAEELTWMVPPAYLARAERDPVRSDDAGRALPGRGDQNGRRAARSPAATPDFGSVITRVVTKTPDADDALTPSSRSTPATTAAALSTPNAPEAAPVTPSADLATVRFGL